MSYLVGNILNGWQERVTRSPKQIDTDHAYIHEGIAFDVWDTSAVNNATRNYRFKTPATKYVHFRPASIGISEKTAVFGVYLCATGSAAPLSGGSTFTPVNRKHYSTNASGVLFATGVATSSTAAYEKMYETKIYGGSGPGQTKSGAAKGEPMEWMFRRGREYCFMITTTGDCNVNMNLFWYEEDGG